MVDDQCAGAGWSRATWDTPGTAEVENQVFDDLSELQQNNIRALGFYNTDQYDCVSISTSAYVLLLSTILILPNVHSCLKQFKLTPHQRFVP